MASLFLSIRTKFVQLRLVKESIHVVMEKPATEGAISAFGALMISTASRVGTGNIVGVSQAICLGGVGAVFWMWLIAIVGGASAFVESTLAQIYKRKNPDGSSYGGPSYYMETALRQHWLGLVWNTADMLQGMMVIINIPVIVILAKPAVDALKDYQKQRAEGKNPVFKAADINLKEKTEFWN